MERKEKSVKEKARSISEEVAQRRKEAKAKGLKFTGLTEEQIYRKLTKKGSPMIIWQSWGDASPGGTVTYNVGIKNPDPNRRIRMFGHVFVGPANMVSDVGVALCAVDTRFPRLTLPDFAGLSIDPGATESLSFSINVPMDVESTNYLGNCFLFRATWHDVGEYLDRGLFVFEIT